MTGRFGNAVGSLQRNSHLPLRARAGKGIGYILALLTAPYRLRRANHRGARARTMGAPYVSNAGSMHIGDDVIINSRFAPCELSTLPSGSLTIGNRVALNFGTTLSAAHHVTLGNDVSIGPYCLLVDHEDGSDNPALGIELSDGVWLASHVTVLPGTTIGSRSVITAGSVVSGVVPPGVVAGGNPARVLRTIDSEEARAAAADSESVTASVDTEVRRRTAKSAFPALPPAALVSPELPPARWRGVVLSDFTVGDLVMRLRDGAHGPRIDVAETPFGVVIPSLLAGAPQGASDFAFVWTRPDSAIPAYQRLLETGEASPQSLIADVDSYCDVLLRGAETWRVLLVASWTRPPALRGRGALLDARPGGAAWALGIMNQRLMERLAAAERAFVLDSQRWTDAATHSASVSKGWYVGKIPFAREVFAEAALDIQASLAALAGESRKLLVLDLDDTMWGGIVGDAGWENLRLGGHDAEGEAHVDFQRAVKRLAAQGVLLAIASKNTESVAIEAIESHPEMLLRKKDFVGWRINWMDKAQNIAELVKELNLGLQSVVFIDDNPVERARVREALPEVLVPEWPSDKLRYPAALAALRCFDAAIISGEDAKRTELYEREAIRASSLKENVGSMEDWLASLEIAVTAEPLTSRNLPRVTQLLNKTNQLNLSTRRFTEPELRDWAALPGNELWAFSVRDRFGDSGLTGLLGLTQNGDVCEVSDFVLSCRVMGRAVEETLTHVAVTRARQMGAGRVQALFRPTAKNSPCFDYWQRSRFDSAPMDDGRTAFSWDARNEYPCPAPVTLDLVANAAV